MDRKKFLSNLFALSVLAAVKSQPLLSEVAKSAENIKADLPGTDKNSFKMLVGRDWFRPGDVVVMNNSRTQWYYTLNSKNEYELKEITNSRAPRTIAVEFYHNSDRRKAEIEGLAKVCSAYSEHHMT